MTYLLVFVSSVSAQTYNFRNHLPDGYIYSIAQDERGLLWAGTGNGLYKFDGYTFHDVVLPDSANSRYVSALLKDSSGRMWIGCNDGAVFSEKDNRLMKTDFPDIRGINQIAEGPDGYVYIIPQERFILKIRISDPEDITIFRVREDISMTAASITPDNRIILGTQENLLLCTFRGDSLVVGEPVEGIEYVKVQSVVQSPGRTGYLIGTEGAGLFALDISDVRPRLSRLKSSSGLESLDIKSIVNSSSGNTWFATYGAGLYETTVSDSEGTIKVIAVYNSENGLRDNNLRAVFEDSEENIWIGMYGSGISMLGSSAFISFADTDNPEHNNLIFVNEEGGRYFLGTPKGYSLFNPATGRSERYTDLSAAISGSEVTTYLKEGDRLWIGTKGKGLYLKTGEGTPRLFYRSSNSGEDYIKSISGDDDHIWLSTLNGVIIIDRNTGRVYRRFKIEEQLPHNSINQVLIMPDGRGLVATECDRLYSINKETGVTTGSLIMSGTTINKILCFTHIDGNAVFAGTAGNGMFCFKNDSIFNVSQETGLFSNYCYSILTDSERKIWVGHVGGFSVFDPLNGSLRTVSTGFAGTGDCKSFFQASDGKVLIATSEGLVVYDRTKEKRKQHIPVSNIVSVTINNRKYPVSGSITLPYSRYVVRIDYAGINLSDPDKVFYSTMMENYDDGWSELKSERSVSYQLKDGRYRFSVTSITQDGLTDNEPASVEIVIKKPVWRTFWFISLMVALIASAIILIVREREKAQRKIKEYLESELAERTKLVMQQKDEIELQNIEITDSINYAKRIQSSILPDVHRLKETFSDAFIIFHPRDIVSGDFYWFDRVSDEKFIIVCADSTGHGVPGAFMSMIGSTLLQDIVSRKGITSPSEVLTNLDKQIFSTLNQNIDVGVSNDGMDMVICELNLKTRLIRFASAMRPVIIIMDGQSHYLKGNRCSVGGESVVEKYFDDQEYYLNPGDSIYMFSDGLPDQFGGRDGKKMKIARLKKLIEEICTKPMEEQKNLITSFYNEWRGDYEQVDDILMMGIRV